MTPDSTVVQPPFPLRLTSYFNERFPLYQVAGQFPMFLAAFWFGQSIVGESPNPSWTLAAGFVALVAYTLMVRCIDDHKDLAHDNEFYPNRVLQRGLITLTHLKIVGLVCFVASIAISIAIDGGVGRVTMWWTIIFVTNNVVQFVQLKWSSIGQWLESRRVLLALSVVPFWGFGSVWIAQMGAGAELVSTHVWWLVVTWCVAALMLEVARKTRTPEDDRPNVVDYTNNASSWTRSLGLNGTVITLVGLSSLAVALQISMLHVVDANQWWTYLALGVCGLIPVMAAGRFMLRRDRFRVKDVSELAAGMWVTGQVVVATALLVVP
ncbi:UbiA family prenyltransferase [Rhodococcus fascians]|nr:UbiA family prenyltransferase [Rhodococcus fascians]